MSPSSKPAAKLPFVVWLLTLGATAARSRVRQEPLATRVDHHLEPGLGGELSPIRFFTWSLTV